MNSSGVWKHASLNEEKAKSGMKMLTEFYWNGSQSDTISERIKTEFNRRMNVNQEFVCT